MLSLSWSQDCLGSWLVSRNYSDLVSSASTVLPLSLCTLTTLGLSIPLKFMSLQSPLHAHVGVSVSGGKVSWEIPRLMVITFSPLYLEYRWRLLFPHTQNHPRHLMSLILYLVSLPRHFMLPFSITVANAWEQTAWEQRELFWLTVSEESVYCNGKSRQNSSYHAGQKAERVYVPVLTLTVLLLFHLALEPRGWCHPYPRVMLPLINQTIMKYPCSILQESPSCFPIQSNWQSRLTNTILY